MPETVPSTTPAPAAMPLKGVAARSAAMSTPLRIFMLLAYTAFVGAIAAGGTYAITRALAEKDQSMVTQQQQQNDPNKQPPAPSNNPAPVPPQSPAAVTIYFYKGPFTQADTTTGTLTFDGVTRSVAADADPFASALDQLVMGPTASETASGDRVAFGFSGTSTCGGANYTLTQSGSTMKVALCKDLDLSNQSATSSGGGYAGISLTMQSNAREEIKKTLKFNGVTTVEVRDQNGQCYAPDVQDTDCTPT